MKKKHLIVLLLLFPIISNSMYVGSRIVLKTTKYNHFDFFKELWDLTLENTPINSEKNINIDEDSLKAFFLNPRALIVKQNNFSTEKKHIGFASFDTLSLSEKKTNLYNLQNTALIYIYTHPEKWLYNYESDIINKMSRKILLNYSGLYTSIAMIATPEDMRKNEIIQDSNFEFVKKLKFLHPLLGKKTLVNLYIKRLLEI